MDSSEKRENDGGGGDEEEEKNGGSNKIVCIENMDQGFITPDDEEDALDTVEDTEYNDAVDIDGMCQLM